MAACVVRDKIDAPNRTAREPAHAGTNGKLNAGL